MSHRENRRPDDRFSEDRESADAPDLADLVFEYIERINAGDQIDEKQILREHPTLGPTIVTELRTYLHFDDETELQELPTLGTLGDYTLRRQIGRGGMGVVYEAWENSMDRAVALKVLPAGVAADDRAFQRFMQEARTAGKLSHPNVVPVHATGQVENTPYFAMELVEGETLAQILAKTKDTEPETETPFGPKDSVEYFGKLSRCFADVADGLQHAHSKGVTHRDIKPSNLIFDMDGRLRVLDFGLARLEGQESLTLSGDFVGTPLYMSPEQARRKKIPVDHRTDVYSLGATMYEAICGRPPFKGKDHADTLSQIIERDPVEPRKVNPRAPKDLETVVLKCLRKDSVDRYGTAEALGQDLRRFVRGDPIEAKPRSRIEKCLRYLYLRKKKVVALSGVVILILSTGLVIQNRLHKHWNDSRLAFEERILGSVAELELLRLTWKDTEEKGDRGGFLSRRGLDGFFLHSGRQRAEATTAALEAASRLPASDVVAEYHCARAWLLLGEEAEAIRTLDRIRDGLDDLPAGRALQDVLTARYDESVAIRGAQPKPGPAPESNPVILWTEFHAARFGGESDRVIDLATRLLDFQREIGEFHVGATIELRTARASAWLAMATDREAAVEDLLFLRNASPESVEICLLVGKAWHHAGHEEFAHGTFERLFGEAPAEHKNEVAIGVLGIYNSLGDHSRSLEWARKLRPGDGLRHRLLAHALTDAGQHADALEHAKLAISERPEDPHSWVCRGLIHRAHGEPNEALRCFREAQRLGPTDKLALLCLGTALCRQGQQSRGIDQLYRARELYPPAVDVLLALAWCHYTSGDTEKAIRSAKDAADLAPRSSSAYNLLGLCHAWRHEFDRAVPYLERAKSLDRSFYAPYLNLGWVFAKRGDFTRAIREYEESTRVLEAGSKEGKYQVNRSKAYAIKGVALARSGRSAEAEEAFDVSLEALPEAAPAHHELAVLLHGEGETDRAIAVLERAVTIDPSFAPAHSTLGLCLLERSRAPDGMKHLEEAVRLDPGNTSLRLNHGFGLYREGDLKPAIELFRETVRELRHESKGSDVSNMSSLARIHLAAALAMNGEAEAASNVIAPRQDPAGSAADRVDALSVCVRSADELTSNPAARRVVLLAEMLFATGHREEAFQVFEAASRLPGTRAELAHRVREARRQ